MNPKSYWNLVNLISTYLGYILEKWLQIIFGVSQYHVILDVYQSAKGFIINIKMSGQFILLFIHQLIYTIGLNWHPA
jgi:hypothetical protein